MTIRELATPVAAVWVGGWLLLMSAPVGAQDCDLSGYRLFIDPGHGGSDPGALGPTGLSEASVNLEVGLYLRDWLEYFGATVAVSRTTDAFIPLTTRATMANQFGAHRFVSVHENWVDNPSVNGTETFTVPNASARTYHLAESALNELLAYLALRNRGVRTASFTVLVRTAMPATLSETSFISNPDQEALLADPDYRFLIAYAHALGVCDHLAVYPSGAREPLADGEQAPSAVRLAQASKLDATWRPQAGAELELVVEKRLFTDAHFGALEFAPSGELIAWPTSINHEISDAQRSPDGRYLVLQSMDARGARLFTLDTKRRTSYDLSAFGIGHQGAVNVSYEAAWSNSGEDLLVSVSEDDGHQVLGSRFYVSDPQGERWTAIHDDGAVKLSPTWSGRSVAFFDSEGAIVIAQLRQR